jgi:hypothetical protein
MKIFLDTANLEIIRLYNDMGLVDGITTNPSLLAKEGGDPQKTMEEISRIIKGDVSLEISSIVFCGSPPSFASNEGFVVMPSTRPMSLYNRIISRLAVSRKIFIVSDSLLLSPYLLY